ncbi:MAG TPA: hypothetical protein PLR90_04035 [Methylophilus sp.]|nr:hypothetical protein [Methylophilus sp.]HQQ33067.1 hypothetical protein [Methylophilus sp.]
MLNSVMEKIHSVLTLQPTEAPTGWSDTLSGMDEMKVLKEVTAHLQGLQMVHVPQAVKLIDAVLSLDRKMVGHTKKATRNYMISLNISRKMQGRIQSVVYDYYRQLYIAYTKFLDIYQYQNKVQIDLEKINLILARHLNVTFQMMKWRYFDDQPAPPGAWLCVHNIIKYAENLAIMNTNLFLYDFHEKETSIASILEQGLMMDTLQAGNLNRVQMQLAERILRTWASNPIFVTKYKQDRYHFSINLGEDKGTQRIRTVEKFADYRFWKTTRLTDMIEAYLCAVDMQKSLDQFGLDGVAPVPVLVKLFKKLRVEWCTEGYERQRRKEKRTKAATLINVSYGLDDICSRLNKIQARNTQSGKNQVRDSFAFEQRIAQQRRNRYSNGCVINPLGNENWWMVDESPSGFAVDLGRNVSDWVTQGRLIGYTKDDDKDTLYIAEIRSVRKLPNGTYRAGMEIISSHSLSVQVSSMQKESSNIEGLSGYFVNSVEASYLREVTFPSLYLGATEDTRQPTSLILPRKRYQRGAKYRLRLDDDEKVVVAGRPLLKHHDWVQVEVTV